MFRSTPNHLRLYSETPPESSGRLGDFWPGLDKLCRAFELVTGWPLQCLPEAAPAGSATTILWSASTSAEGTEAEQVRVAVATAEGTTSSQPQIDLHAAVDLAGSIGQLLGDLARARQALWKREAELAAGVPLSPRSNEPHLAQRLQSSLRGAAQAVGCQSAALYLVDESTTYLKLRSVWGLPQERLLLPPRELARAAADLEALLGHAIVLDDAAAQAAFQPPESSASAVCVPVSSATAPLGTLWVFGDRPQEFSDQNVNVVEVVAGRIAAELEREMLVAAGADAWRRKRQLSAAERWQDRQLPHVSPLSDVWQVAGWTQAAGELSAEFYDWFVRDDDSLAITLGGSQQEAIEAALSASALRAAVRAFGHDSNDPAATMGRVNQAIFSGSPGDQTAALFLAFADAQSPIVKLASAGEGIAWKITSAGPCQLCQAAPAVGLNAETVYTPREEMLNSDDLLVVLSEGALRTCQQAGLAAAEELASLLTSHRDQPATVLVELIHDRLTALAVEGSLNDCTALVLKCR